MVDGLAIQKAIDDDFDLSRPYAVLEVLLREGLPELLGTDLSGSSESVVLLRVPGNRAVVGLGVGSDSEVVRCGGAS